MLLRTAMFNPSELEGEVDHSFFDSDRDSRSEHTEKKVEQTCKYEDQNPAASASLHANTSKSTTGDKSLRTESNESVSQIKSPTKRSRTKSSRKGRSRVTTASTAPHRWKSISSESSSDCDNETNSNDKRYKEPYSASRVNIKELNDKDVHRSMHNENQEDQIAFSLNSKKQKPVKSYIRNLSPSSTVTDEDLESCSSQRSSLASPTIPQNIDTSSSPGLRRNKEKVSGPEKIQATSTDESDYSVTDVSPLSSPDSDKSLCLNQSNAELIDHEDHQEESMPSSGLSNIHQQGSFDQDVDECSSLSLESEFQDKVVIHYPGRRSRKNYSFTNDEVRRIDRENQRLLRELSRLSPGPRPESALRRKKTWTSTSPLAHFSHSAINRQRELQRIQTENLAFLKKLESVKPTPGLKRSEQLADYQRHVAYRGAPSYQICRSALNKGRSSSVTSTGPRSVSSRAALTTDSDSTPLPRRQKISSPRPAWC